MTTIGILETGVPPPDLVARYGRYDAMMRRMLGDGFGYRSYDVQAGELPAAPEDNAAYVITGSSAGVYDPLPWIAPLKGFIRSAQGRAKLVGICFGHQVMAEALGGRVEKSGKGWGLGLHTYEVAQAAPWMDRNTRRISVAASHQDQVVAVPEGVTVLGHSAFARYAMLAYPGGDAISVQFHPEFERGFAEALVDLRGSRIGPDAAERAMASLGEPSDAPRVAGWLRRFIMGA